jgi:F-type H+-transporting ATPase subunit epsilon
MPTMPLTVLTPDKKVLETHIESMRVLLPDGWWGILPGHAPMISFIHSSVVYYRLDGQTRYIALYQGTIEVRHDERERAEVLILTAAAEEGEDPETVQAALTQQAEKLAEMARAANLEFNQMKLALEKSLQTSDIMNAGK